MSVSIFAATTLGLESFGVEVEKVARTIVDLEESDQVLKPHLAEALQYRFSHE